MSTEDTLYLQMRALKLPLPQRQYLFAKPERKYRGDFVWPDRRLIIECEGQVHSIRAIRESDIVRRQWCYFNNWAILSVSAKQVRSGAGIQIVERALSQ